MKVYLNNQIIEKVTSEREIWSFCYFTRHNINCFNFIYACLHGCVSSSSYYKESNTDNSLFKL